VSPVPAFDGRGLLRAAPPGGLAPLLWPWAIHLISRKLHFRPKGRKHNQSLKNFRFGLRVLVEGCGDLNKLSAPGETRGAELLKFGETGNRQSRAKRSGRTTGAKV